MSLEEKLFLNIKGFFYFESWFKSKIVDNSNNFLIANQF